jgi:hypothetical protein
MWQICGDTWCSGSKVASIQILLTMLQEHGTAIHDMDDGCFVIERIGIMSQYFMAASPKHPFHCICVMRCLSHLLDVTKVGW